MKVTFDGIHTADLPHITNRIHQIEQLSEGQKLVAHLKHSGEPLKAVLMLEGNGRQTIEINLDIEASEDFLSNALDREIVSLNRMGVDIKD